MDSQDGPSPRDVCVRNLQIVVGTLAFAVVAFMAVLLFRPELKDKVSPEEAREKTPTLTSFGMVFWVISVPLGFAASGLAARSARRNPQGHQDASRDGSKPDQTQASLLRGSSKKPNVITDPMLAAYWTRTIVRVAIWEAPAFFLCLEYKKEGSIAYVVMASVLLVLIVSQFPTRDKLTRWLEAQTQTSEIR